MSTKGSLKYKTESFHLYAESGDPSGDVYLSLTDPVCEIVRVEHGKPVVTVRIPREIWNEIIKVGERFRSPV